MVLSVTALEYNVVFIYKVKSSSSLFMLYQDAPIPSPPGPAAVLKLIVSIFAALALMLLLFQRPLQNQSNLVKYETGRQRVNQQIFSEIKQNHYLSL